MRKTNLHWTLLKALFVLAGWWLYDERTSKELETCYKSGERTCELLIAGFLYVADLEAMLQMRRNDPSRRRRIKRDLASIPKKGRFYYFYYFVTTGTKGHIQKKNTKYNDD